jgi:hypothetical protein
MSKKSRVSITIPRIKIDPLKLAFISSLGVWGFNGALNYENFFFLHNFNLIIHEAGHVIFMFLGEFITFLGGTLLQLMIPIGAITSFFLRKEFYNCAVCLFWLSVNFFDVSRYMSDARSQELPLLGGEAVTHDWFYLFGRMGLLNYDQTIGKFVYIIACFTCLTAILGGCYYSQTKFNHDRVYPQE